MPLFTEVYLHRQSGLKCYLGWAVQVETGNGLIPSLHFSPLGHSLPPLYLMCRLNLTSSKILRYNVNLRAMSGPQFQEGSQVSRLLLLNGTVFLPWDPARLGCQNGIDRIILGDSHCLYKDRHLKKFAHSSAHSQSGSLLEYHFIIFFYYLGSYILYNYFSGCLCILRHSILTNQSLIIVFTIPLFMVNEKISLENYFIYYFLLYAIDFISIIYISFNSHQKLLFYLVNIYLNLSM